jgi:hypothetical protein
VAAFSWLGDDGSEVIGGNWLTAAAMGLHLLIIEISAQVRIRFKMK